MQKMFFPAFRRFVKKQFPPLQLAIQDEVDRIIADPMVGDEKKAHLTGVRVHKFKFHGQQYLIAYERGIKSCFLS